MKLHFWHLDPMKVTSTLPQFNFQVKDILIQYCSAIKERNGLEWCGISAYVEEGKMTTSETGERERNI